MKSARLLAVPAAIALFSHALIAQDAKPTPDAKKAEAAKSSAAKPAAAKTHTIKSGPFRVDVQLKGVFESRQSAEISLRPKAWTTLEVDKAVRHGAAVKQGEPILWLDTEKLDRELESARNAVELGDLDLKQQDVSLKALEQTVPLDLEAADRTARIATEELDYFLQTDRAQQEKSAKFSLESSQHYLEYSQEELNQLEKMYKEDDLTEETEEIILKRARRSVESAQRSLERSKLRTVRSLETLIPRAEVEFVESRKRSDLALARAKATLPASLRKAHLSYLKTRHTHGQAVDRLRKLEQDRKHMVVHAPIAGVVYHGRFKLGKWLGKATVESQLRKGGTVSAKSVVMTIVAPAPLQVRVEVPEKSLALVSQGVQGKATPTAFPDLHAAATVQNVDAYPVAAGTFDGVLSVNLPAGTRIVPGMACGVKLTPYRKAAALTAPKSAVFSEDDNPDAKYVYLSKDGKSTKQAVKTGRQNDKSVEITAGLKAGDVILVEKPKAEK